MHLHLPKPLHGWRAFVGEVGIIVIGVLIALAFEQVVEAWRWRERAAEGRERLRAEVGHQFLLVEERRAVTQCIDQQLTKIEDAVLAAGAVLKPLPLYEEHGLRGLSFGEYRFVLRTPSHSWTDSAWQSVIAEGLSAHLTSEERRLLPIHYAQMARVSALNAEDDVAAGDLAALSKPLALDPQVKASFIRGIEAERQRNEALGGYSVQMMKTISDVDYVPSNPDRRASLANSGTIKFCRAHGYAVVGS